jgi:hypothetical protein
MYSPYFGFAAFGLKALNDEPHTRWRLAIAHEILHHVVWELVPPHGDHLSVYDHDSEGIMYPYSTGGRYPDKLGCDTLRTLLSIEGISRSDIHKDAVVPYAREYLE